MRSNGQIASPEWYKRSDYTLITPTTGAYATYNARITQNAGVGDIVSKTVDLVDSPLVSVCFGYNFSGDIAGNVSLQVTNDPRAFADDNLRAAQCIAVDTDNLWSSITIPSTSVQATGGVAGTYFFNSSALLAWRYARVLVTRSSGTGTHSQVLFFGKAA